MCECGSRGAKDYIDALEGDSLPCTDESIESRIIIAERPQRFTCRVRLFPVQGHIFFRYGCGILQAGR